MVRLTYLLLPFTLLAVAHDQKGAREEPKSDDSFAVLRRFPPARIKADFTEAARAFPNLLAKAKKQGLVIDDRAEKADAGPRYKAAIGALFALPESVWRPARQAMIPGWEDNFAPIYSSLKPVLASIDEASRLAYCTVDTTMFTPRTASQSQFNQICELERRAALFELGRDNVSAFRHYLETAARVSNHLSSCPTLISEMTQANTMRKVEETCELALKDHGSRSDVRVATAQILRILRAPQMDKKLIAGEYKAFTTLTDFIPKKSWGDDGKHLPAPIRSLAPKAFVAAASAGRLRFNSKVMRTLAQRTKSAPEVQANLRKLTTAGLASKNAVEAYTAPSYAAWDGVYEITVKVATRLEMEKAAVVIFNVRAKSGAFPSKLPVGCPLDPFTKKPFTYQKSGTGFVLSGGATHDILLPFTDAK